MHHLISNDTSFLSVEPAEFEAQCRLLAENGWFGVGLEEAENFLIHGEPLPPKSFLLTFDDGFLDNYVYAWPIMQKYGHKGVVFAVAEKITQAQEECEREGGSTLLRPTIADIDNGRYPKEALPAVDSLIHQDPSGYKVRKDLFFNWDEARAMEKSGTMSVAAHSLKHAKAFKSAEFSSFLQPTDIRISTWENISANFWGMPQFKAGSELANRAFIPSPLLLDEIQKFVPQDKKAAAEFFSSATAKNELMAIIKKHENNLGNYESEAEQSTRFRNIMTENRQILQKELGHPVKSFCWPWGEYCEAARQAGIAAGFEAFYTTKIGINRPGFPLGIHRFPVKNQKDGGAKLLNRIRLYSRPLIGSLYLKIRM